MKRAQCMRDIIVVRSLASIKHESLKVGQAHTSTVNFDNRLALYNQNPVLDWRTISCACSFVVCCAATTVCTHVTKCLAGVMGHIINCHTWLQTPAPAVFH